MSHYSFAFGVVLALASGGAQTSPTIEFTRPTVIAVRLDAEPRASRVLHEDDTHLFASQDYGTAEKPERPGFFVYSKTRRVWIEILGLTTEHARLGRSPDPDPDTPMLAISWDYGHLIAEPFTREMWGEGVALNFPDRILHLTSPAAYRLDFNSRLQREESLTCLWLLKSDLEAAFDGRRTPAQVAQDFLAGLAIPMDPNPSDGLMVPVRINSGEWLRWGVDTKVPGILLDGAATRFPVLSDVKQGRVDLTVGRVPIPNQLVTFGRASRHNNVGGLLGATLFDRFAVSFDFDRKQIHLLEPSAVDERAVGLLVAIEWDTGPPIMTGQLDVEGKPTADLRLCIDTVEPKPLVLRQAVAGARVKSLRLGSFRFDNLPVVVDSTIATGCDGVMGKALMKRFRLTFDRRRQRVFLLPGALMDVPYDYDMTGATIVANGRAFGVSSVEYPSIASVAGLQAGDVIVELDGQAVSGMSLVELRRSFRHDGRPRTLTIQRRWNPQVVTLSMPLLQ